jgi:hypothetical protein
MFRMIDFSLVKSILLINPAPREWGPFKTLTNSTGLSVYALSKNSDCPLPTWSSGTPVDVILCVDAYFVYQNGKKVFLHAKVIRDLFMMTKAKTCYFVRQFINKSYGYCGNAHYEFKYDKNQLINPTRPFSYILQSHNGGDSFEDEYLDWYDHVLWGFP